MVIKLTLKQAGNIMKKTLILITTFSLLILIIVVVFYILHQQKLTPSIPKLLEPKNFQSQILEQNALTQNISQSTLVLPSYQPISESDKDSLNSFLINSDYQNIIETFPTTEQNKIAAVIQTIIVQLLQTNQNINWWQKTLSILKKENSLHNLSNLNFDQLKNVYVTSVKLTDSEFQSSNNLGIENQELIFVSDVQLIQNEDQTFDCQLIWIFNISCPLGNSCRINYNQLPSLVSLQ